ncbi:hypothetical protein P1X15_10975 [Runella sp. MFBS21]|uniref:hypothetical protein n=1 Tax=Runella sp. MFBS21 TaxID=3034018 RepID=UPI0023F64651|nr:hypothetical protein [Runella sp. MFBS21]MDF7818123.1 hypothetical protein [Runella sp. MFBS21]
MIANSEKKDFKTITLRDMNEKPDLVNIMNEVMEKEGIKTGQSVIEYIIKDYDCTKKAYQALQNKSEEQYRDYYRWRNEFEEKYQKLEENINLVKKAFKILIK